MKKFINDVFDYVDESVEGYAAAFPSMVRQVGHRVIIRADAPVSGKVGVLIGGGSGHEPLFMGYAGKGLADGSPIGNTFASPSSEIILEATRAVSAGAGVIYLYGNYSGDVMNFDDAAEKAGFESIRVETVRVTDDIASAPANHLDLRRGIAGDFFVFKIAGAMADTGASLDEVVRVAGKANDRTRSMGVSLSSCTIPASGNPILQMDDGDMEIGLGIHGEAGRQRQKIAPADHVTSTLIAAILDEDLFRKPGRVALMVNSLGATPLAELYIVFRCAERLLSGAGFTIHRSYVGPYSTSLDMVGCSITLILLDDEIARLIDHPASCPCFTQVS